ncbi:hypothetical protein TWF281_011049 [Arthrobotrys megalospora]
MSTREEILALVVANETKRITDLSAAAINDVTKEIKSTILSKCRWEELLMTAPVAIYGLGGCFIASSSPVVSATRVPTFQYKATRYSGHPPETVTSPESLQAAFVECSNLGRYAFLETEKGMGRISTMASQMIGSHCQHVIECLNGPPDAKKYIALRMGQLKKAAVDCHETAILIDQKFEEWLVYVCKLYVSCVEQQSATEYQRLHHELDVKTEEIKGRVAEENVSIMKEQSQNLEGQVKQAKEDYRKAMDSFPGGWEVFLGDLASGYISTMSSAMNAMVSVGAGHLQTTGRAGAMGVMGAELGGPTETANDTQQQLIAQGLAQKLAMQVLGGQNIAGGAQQGTWAGFSQSPAGFLINPAGRMTAGVGDSAYIQLNNAMVYLNILKSIINGSDGGVDWEQVADDTSGGSGLLLAYTMLASIQESFQPAQPIGDASSKLMTVLNTVTEITHEIRGAAAKPEKLNRADPTVRKWQDEFNTQYNIAYQLQVDGRKHPGNPVTAIPVIGGLQKGAQAILSAVQQDGGGGKAARQVMVDNARTKADAANAALKEANEELMGSSKMLSEQEAALAEVNAHFARLQTSRITPGGIRDVLAQLIALIVKMKAQIEKMVKFFSAIETTIDVTIKAVVEPFANESAIALGGSLESINKHYSVDDFTRTSILHGVMTIRAYLSVHTDVAKMWVTLSDRHISPGLTLAEKVGMARNEDASVKMRELENWVSGARAGIENLSKSTQGKVEAEMCSRVEKMAEITTLLLPSQEEMKAIENAKSEGRIPPVTISLVTDDFSAW